MVSVIVQKSVKIEPEEYDVVVVGGGPAGISAAVSSARLGKKVAIVERYGYLGGQATGGLVILLVGLTDGKRRIFKGFCQEVIDRLFAVNAAKDVGHHVLFDAENMKYLFDCMVLENEIRPYYHSFVSSVIKEDNSVKGVVLEGKSGSRLLKSKCFIDASGDADLAEYAGVDFVNEGKENLLPITLGCRVGGVDINVFKNFVSSNFELYKSIFSKLKISANIGGWIQTLNPGEVWLNLSNIERVDVTDSDELTKAEMIGRQQIFGIIDSFKKELKGFENAYLIDTAPQIGTRESRKIVGMHNFSLADIEENFEDTICLAPNYKAGNKGYVQVPLRCLISKDVDNVIFAGRSISVEHELIDMFREIPCCMATGQAAGVAASVFVDSPSNSFCEVDFKVVQKNLLLQNALIDDLESIASKAN